MGSLLAAKLAPLVDVWLITGWREHAAAIQADGLVLDQLDGSQIRVRLPVVQDACALPSPVDLAIVAVKSSATGQASRRAAEVLAPTGLALTLQNGLGNLEIIAGAVGSERALQGVTSQGATMLGPGRVRHAGEGPTTLARPAGNAHLAARVEEITALFRAAGLETHVAEDLDGLIWGKLAINAGINALTAILRVPNGMLAQVGPARELMAAAAEETAAVARVKGVNLPYESAASRAEQVAQATARNRSSMLQDILRGAPTEIEVINAAVVREGEKLGIATPVNRTLTYLVRSIELTSEQRL